MPILIDAIKLIVLCIENDRVDRFAIYNAVVCGSCVAACVPVGTCQFIQLP